MNIITAASMVGIAAFTAGFVIAYLYFEAALEESNIRERVATRKARSLEKQLRTLTRR